MPTEPGRGRLVRAAFAAVLLLEWALIAFLARGITLDFPHGFDALFNILAVTRALRDVMIQLWRPPLPWLVVAAPIGAAYRLWGPQGAMTAAHALMPGFLVLGAWLSYRLYLRKFSAGTALTAAALLAANPLALVFSPFALFDVFSMMDGTAFVLAGVAFAERRTPKRWLLLVGCYCATLLSRYHMAVLGALPALFVFAAPRPWSFSRAVRETFFSCAWAVPLVAAPLIAGLYVALPHVVPWAPDPRAFFIEARMYASERSTWATSLYARSLYEQLGPALCALAALGAGRWLAKGRAFEQQLLIALVVPVVVLSTVIAQRDQRYILFLLPLVYAAVAEGLDLAVSLAGGGRKARAALLAAAALCAPWRASLRSLRAVARDPAYRLPLYQDLARRVAAEQARGACLENASGGVIVLRTLPAISNDSPMLLLGDRTLAYFLPPAPRLAPVGEGCASWVLVVPKFLVTPIEATRWDSAEVVRVYVTKGAEAPQTLVWKG